MATYVTLQFNDGEINLSTSSFLFKQSKLLQSIDIDEDNMIPILCSRSYILDDDNNTFLFDDKTDLSFMFTRLPNKFIEVCKFLDIICYENEDILFSKLFITFVMKNIKEEINIIRYFMQPEIRSIMNYLNKEDINLQIKSCIFAFYYLYLTEYKEEVIKHNRIDIFELSTNKRKYYRYINKYDNHFTYHVKETQEYKDYVINISKQLLHICSNSNNINKITDLIEQGANVNLQNNNGNTALHIASNIPNNLEVIKYLVEQGANVNLQNNNGNTALHYASLQTPNNLEDIKLLVENGANVNLQNNYGYTALHLASLQTPNNLKVIEYLVKHGVNVNLQNIDGNTALHFSSHRENNLEVIRYLVEHGTDINLQNNDGWTALHHLFRNSYILIKKNKKINKLVRYFVEHGADLNIRNNFGQIVLYYYNTI